MTSLLIAAALLLHPAPHAAAAAQSDGRAEAPVQERTSLGGGLYVITGRGGNILFFTGEDGTFVVDDQFADIAPENIALINEVAEGPLAYVLNTHYHGDHAGGNPVFAEEGATIVSTGRVRERLAAGESGEALAKPEALPRITFDGLSRFYLGEQTIWAMSLPPAHTDGDSLAYFEEANVLHTGDVFFAGRYPYIDVEGGGSISGMIKALETILAVAGPDTVIVPGHGPVGDKTAVAEALAMLKDVRTRIAGLRAEDMSREEVVAQKPLADYDERYGWRFIGPERMAGQVYDSLGQEERDGLPAYQKSVPETLTGPEGR